MEKKYYYDCPIKAAYMNHEFGVITYIELSNEGGIYDKYFIKDWNHRELELDAKNKYHCNKYYVAPESEHIFEPKEGDIGICDKLLIPVKFDIKDWVSSKMLKKETYYEIKETLFVKTVYRNGKHFFNPKEED